MTVWCDDCVVTVVTVMTVWCDDCVVTDDGVV